MYGETRIFFVLSSCWPPNSPVAWLPFRTTASCFELVAVLPSFTGGHFDSSWFNPIAKVIMVSILRYNQYFHQAKLETSQYLLSQVKFGVNMKENLGAQYCTYVQWRSVQFPTTPVIFVHGWLYDYQLLWVTLNHVGFCHSSVGRRYVIHDYDIITSSKRCISANAYTMVTLHRPEQDPARHDVSIIHVFLSCWQLGNLTHIISS